MSSILRYILLMISSRGEFKPCVKFKSFPCYLVRVDLALEVCIIPSSIWCYTVRATAKKSDKIKYSQLK